jgi:hypothetical protein
MKTPEKVDLEMMALAVELARQLGHDFSNFLYNLLLQIEIWETSRNPQKAPDWEHLKRDGQKMVRVLNEWHDFHNRFSMQEVTKIDLHQLIQQVAAKASLGGSAVQLSPSISAEPLWVTGSPVCAGHLLRLLLEDTVHKWEDATGVTPALSIETEIVKATAIVRIIAVYPCEGTHSNAEEPPRDDDQQPSLVEATCQSLALRLEATIQRERHADGRHLVQVEFTRN